MEQYLIDWWNNNLIGNYTFCGLEIYQLNKLIKGGQYLVGLLAIFELIHFSVVMRGLKIVSFLSIFAITLPTILINLPNLVFRLLVGALINITGGGLTWDEIIKSLKSFRDKAFFEAKDEASQHSLVATFHWLETHPLSDNTRRVIVFLSFAILALCDLFTS